MRRAAHGRTLRWLSWCAVAATLVSFTAPAARAHQPAGPSSSPRPASSAGAPTSNRGHWSVTVGQDGVQLGWRSPTPIPVGDGRVEFRDGQQVIGFPTLARDHRTLTLTLSSGTSTPTDPAVWVGLHRLDATAAPMHPYALARPPDIAGRSAPGDPGRAGHFDVESFDYEAAPLAWPQFKAPLEVLGHAVLPVGRRHAPLVLFLHGRHNACYGRGDDGSWPCAGGSKPVPSYLGYDYLQRLLASQGYATVSVSANAINAQDWRASDGGARARAALVIHHLELLAGFSADRANRQWRGRLDLSHVILVGHSRGGEGVDQAAIESSPSAPYQLAGQVLIAPTDFSYQTAPYLPTEVLLPYCDGDVFDLQGQRYVDAAPVVAPDDPSLRSSVLLLGANHNFFNTEWTPGQSVAPSWDDWWDKRDPVCGSKVSPTRLTPAEQQRAAMTYVAAGVHAFLRDDQTDALRYIDAAEPVAIPDAGPAVALTHALGGNRTTVGLDAGASADGAATPCRAGQPSPGGFGKAAEPLCGIKRSYRQVHWTPTYLSWASVYSAYAATGLPQHEMLRWSAPPGTQGGLRLAQPMDLSRRGTRLDLRVVVDPATTSGEVEVVLGSGDATWSGPPRPVTPLGRKDPLTPLWAQTIRIDPASFAGHIDLDHVDSIQLRATGGSGRVWILDASRVMPGMRDVPDRALPRIRLGRVTVSEGDDPNATALVPFRVLGDVTTPATFAVAADQSTFGYRRRPQYSVVTVTPGQTKGTIAVPYEADTIDDAPRQTERVYAVVRRGLVMSEYTGTVRIRDDDPAPTMTWRAVRAHVTYGHAMRFRLQLSAPVDYYIFARLHATRVPGLRPVRTSDIPKRWLRTEIGRRVPADVPLGRVWHYGYLRLRPGATHASLVIPTLRKPLHTYPKALTIRLMRELRATVHVHR
ncbi:MAG TPA: hypothetical protein VE442_02825 [Jatrophihabitans sp.]|nr:hypothetical protein [Jatrophihabitans sp.]